MRHDAVERRNDLWDRLAPVARHGPLREGAFTSDLRTQRMAALLGAALGVCFFTAFFTGWLSHLIQNPPSWFLWTSRPAGLYRVTQGLHVVTGIAAIPLLLVKLWVVIPKFYDWPPVRGVAHLLERLALLPLVGGGLFLLGTGMANIVGWYPWPFGFIQGHYAASWITIGALVVHIGAKWSISTRELSPGRRDERRAARLAEPDPVREDGGLTRRGLLWVTGTAAGALTLLTVGQTIRPLAPLSLLAPRDPRVGGQGVPINRSAARAGVEESAVDPGYRLIVEGDVATPLELSYDDLLALPQRSAALPIACVEGWSATAMWRGVPVAELLAMAGAPEGASVRVGSLEERGPYRSSDLNRLHAHDPDTLLALQINGQDLSLDHGFPVRLIGPNRPGVMNTKWVTKLTVQA